MLCWQCYFQQRRSDYKLMSIMFIHHLLFAIFRCHHSLKHKEEFLQKSSNLSMQDFLVEVHAMLCWQCYFHKKRKNYARFSKLCQKLCQHNLSGHLIVLNVKSTTTVFSAGGSQSLMLAHVSKRA